MAIIPPSPRLDEPRQAQQHLRAAIQPCFLSTATALLVCCDRDAVPFAHLHVVGCDPSAAPSDVADVLQTGLDRLDGEGPRAVAGLALGLTRPGSDQVQPSDRIWFRAFHRVCHRHGLVAHGVYVVSRAGARAIHIDDAA